jgi:hypothetical protein
MVKFSGRLIGGPHHGEPFEIPLNVDALSIINSESRYLTFGIVSGPTNEQRMYCVHVSLTSNEQLTDQAMSLIEKDSLWDWGAPYGTDDTPQ